MTDFANGEGAAMQPHPAICCLAITVQLTAYMPFPLAIIICNAPYAHSDLHHMRTAVAGLGPTRSGKCVIKCMQHMGNAHLPGNIHAFECGAHPAAAAVKDPSCHAYMARQITCHNTLNTNQVMRHNTFKTSSMHPRRAQPLTPLTALVYLARTDNRCCQ